MENEKSPRQADVIQYFQLPNDDFVKCSKDDSKLEILSESNNMYRTIASLFFSIFALILFEKVSEKIGFSNETIVLIICILLFILFTWSYKKQTSYITKRINAWRK